MVDDSDEIVIDSDLPSVGERLKVAREAKNLTISEVGAQLRLTKETIVNLETEQWELLHGRAYARGYFSNYVKFLGLPERELLSAFNVEYKVTEASLLSTQQLNSTSGSRFPWLPAIIFIIVIAMTWFAYKQWLNSQESLDVTEIVSSPWEYLEEEQATADAFDVSVVKPLVETILDKEEKQTVEQHKQSDDEITELVSHDAVENEPTVELQFLEDSWVEVRDADRQALLNKVMKADEKIIISGKFPLTITLGRADAVIIKYNNAVFDTTPYTEGDVARFVIG